MNQVPAKASFRDVQIADHGGGGKLMPQTFGEVVEFSKVMAMSQHAIPKHLRDVPGACLAVAMQALRWEMDPFAVASKSYNVKDIISYEAQLIAAVVHTRAPLKSRPEYAFTGEGADLRCVVSAVFDDGIERSYESPRFADIPIKNSPLWKSDPQQQLGYYSIRSFARRYCPEVILGVYTPEEAETFRGPDNARDVTPRATLQERLASAPAGDAPGFSQQHVISEIDGEQNSNSSSAPPPPAAVDDAPASTVSPDQDAGATTQQQADTEWKSPLPEGWPITYAATLRRAQKKDSLSKYAAEYWKQYGGWEKHKATPDGEQAAAIYRAFETNFGDKDAIDADLRELI